MLVNVVQLEKEDSSILDIFPCISTVFKLVHSEKAWAPSEVTLRGTVIVLSFSQLLNALTPIVIKVDGRLTCAKFEHA